MDHSILGYLNRQSTQVLLVLLWDYTADSKIANYFPVISIIVKILSTRNVPIPPEIPKRITDYLNSEK